MEAARICCSLEIDTMFRSSNTLLRVKNTIAPRKKGLIDETPCKDCEHVCVHRWNSISPSWAALISAYSSPNSQTSGYSHLSLSTFQLYSYHTVSSSFSPNYIPFLELLLVSTEGDLWSEIFGSKVVALCYNLVQWYSYGIKICSNEPLQFQLSSTFTMHLTKYIRWKVPWCSEFI